MPCRAADPTPQHLGQGHMAEKNPHLGSQCEEGSASRSCVTVATRRPLLGPSAPLSPEHDKAHFADGVRTDTPRTPQE